MKICVDTKILSAALKMTAICAVKTSACGSSALNDSPIVQKELKLFVTSFHVIYIEVDTNKINTVNKIIMDINKQIMITHVSMPQFVQYNLFCQY